MADAAVATRNQALVTTDRIEEALADEEDEVAREAYERLGERLDELEAHAADATE